LAYDAVIRGGCLCRPEQGRHEIEDLLRALIPGVTARIPATAGGDAGVEIACQQGRDTLAQRGDVIGEERDA
jgi:hypothetical protein